ncbi:MAG: hypothetical protein IIX14_07790 [Clostridia bacterium]|nr:hypothetical protein [Clostridia bacterium]
MSKKILSLALAVVMLFSVCAVAVSAADYANAEDGIRIYMTSTAKIGDIAGTVVDVSYYIDLPDGVDELQMNIGNIAIGWNSAAYKINSTNTTNAADARTWGDDFGLYMKSTCAVTVSSAISNNILKKATAEEAAKWDKACQVQMLNDGANSLASKGHPIYDKQHIFTLSFVAQKTLTADDVIGVVTGAYGQSFFKVCGQAESGAFTYSAAQVDMADAAVVPSAPAYDVFNLKGSTGAIADKHANGDGTYTVAVFYGFDFNPEFNANGTSQFINSISATVTATAGGNSITVASDPIKYVWVVGEGYGFRVILKNVPENADITVVPSVVTNGTSYNVETVSFNVANAYAA